MSEIVIQFFILDFVAFAAYFRDSIKLSNDLSRLGIKDLQVRRVNERKLD